eukprot:TRINITY_DN19625_c0_g2_i1.p1 TRINITY_DN19625_c0_g2~~TRINITY_DN19625_c0_g2_i1.p1  ORF type:complete len:256 (+),score=30.15 TRINITY_DN19625_c0_g2_i1:57-824(+)
MLSEDTFFQLWDFENQKHNKPKNTTRHFNLEILKMFQQDIEQKKSFVIVHNISKRANIGTLLRCCTAFNVTTVCLTGSRQFNTFGAHGSGDFVHLMHFDTLDDCVQYLKSDHKCRIIGIEITEDAVSISKHPFEGNSAFMLGNEGTGMTQKQISLCDSFVYIPQFGPGTASLNVTVAASIVLHHFATWAGFQERQRQGQKFIVDERPQRTNPKGVVPLSPEEAKRERMEKQARKTEDWLMEGDQTLNLEEELEED